MFKFGVQQTVKNTVAHKEKTRYESESVDTTKNISRPEGNINTEAIRYRSSNKVANNVPGEKKSKLENFGNQLEL